MKHDLQSTKPTPMMQQWHECKKKAPNAIILFRLGDFYEGFYDDAHILSEELQLTLTHRSQIPMAGIPHHSSTGYIEKLLQKGHLVAVVEQLENAAETKGLVKRDITRIFSPATYMSDTYLSQKMHSYIACICELHSFWGLSLIDLSTGDFHFAEFNGIDQLCGELAKYQPKELLLSEAIFKKTKEPLSEALSLSSIRITKKESWDFHYQVASKALLEHFRVHTLDGFGISEKRAATIAAGSLLLFLEKELLQPIAHIHRLSAIHNLEIVQLDPSTIRHLELIPQEDRKTSLLSSIDYTTTPMGGRFFLNALLHPLTSLSEIENRLELVGAAVEHSALESLRTLFRKLRDVERLTTKLCVSSASPRDLLALRHSLETIPSIVDLTHSLSKEWEKQLDFPGSLQALTTLLQEGLSEDPPIRVSEGGVIRSGYNEKLDQLRVIRDRADSFIREYESTLRSQYDCKTLKIEYTKAFGYYIEVSKGQAHKIPLEKKQTLVNCERFTSAELKRYEHETLQAESLLFQLESQLFEQLVSKSAEFARDLRVLSQSIASSDFLLSLAYAAKIHRFVKPSIHNGYEIEIIGGRHPVVEQMSSEAFIPNTTHLSPSQSFHIITGPNMGGKSTYIRQVALITIMAQMGSFVPAERALIGIVDGIYTRIGAGDDLSRGQSTFMVEMVELARIVRSATKRSLVILDEVGRGTSTFDGISIARAASEFLLSQTPPIKTLFATHYFELTELTQFFPCAKNYHFTAQEVHNDGSEHPSIVFLHTIQEGKADRSYGIHVAALAGMPPQIIHRAKEILKELENGKHVKGAQASQLSLFSFVEQTPSKIETALKEVSINETTPLKALEILARLQKELK